MADSHHLFKPHPWHGISIGRHAPEAVTCYLEIVPVDTVKYEVDKESGYLRIDRPQRFSNVCPTPYGFMPRTCCGPRVAERSSERIGKGALPGDDDPFDICVFTERDLAHGDVLATAVPIGGLRLVDGDVVDDKIIGVLEGDGAYGGWREISDCPAPLIERLRHYFLTYKSDPDFPDRHERFIAEVYGREEAHEMIRRSLEDYRERFAEIAGTFDKWVASKV